MQVFQPRELLDLWERGQGQHPVDRALTLLGAVHWGTPRRELAEWCLGERDTALLALHRSNFGDVLQATGSCPECAETVDVQIRIADLLGGEDRTPKPDGDVTVNGRTIRFRFPNSLDIAAIAGSRDLESARSELMRRVVGDDPTQLSDEEIEALEAAIEAGDPHTEISLQLGCPECGLEWTESLDVTAFLWDHLAASAERILWQVDRLARAYGWTEDEVLALSSARRQWYVEATG
jgi:hypothetical protein